MGLPEVLENLIILTYAHQGSRVLTLQGIPVNELISSLRNETVLERLELPEQAVWETNAH